MEFLNSYWGAAAVGLLLGLCVLWLINWSLNRI